jgi:hypothetical protein
MRYLNVTVTRSPMDKVATTIAPWELKLLQLLHSSENVEVTGETFVEKEYPDGETEAKRLFDKYKVGNSGVVANVYGSGSDAGDSIQVAIDKARAADKGPPKKDAKGKVIPPAPVRPATGAAAAAADLAKPGMKVEGTTEEATDKDNLAQ